MGNLRHQSLVAWQRADDLFIRVHKLTRETIPASERFELSSQLRHFLNIAESSLAEVAYRSHATRRLGYLSGALYAELETELNR